MKNKNALKYEMTDWKQLQIRKQNTKEVISVQKTKLRQELKRQRLDRNDFEKLYMWSSQCWLFCISQVQFITADIFIPGEQPLVFLCGMKA